MPDVSWGDFKPTIVGVHWLRADGTIACAEPFDRATPAMGGVTCSVCRAIIDIEIDTLAEVVSPSFRVPMPAPASDFDLSDSSIP